MPRKPWAKSSWRTKRAEFIKDKTCEWCSSSTNLVIHHPQKKNSLSDDEYTSFKGAMVLCKRCHGAWHKGYHLCPTCKTHYVRWSFPQCWECAGKPKKGELKKRREQYMAELEKEDETEIPLVDVITPCGAIITTYQNQAEWGMMECCMHECPNQQIKGNVNQCEAYKKYNEKQGSSSRAK